MAIMPVYFVQMAGTSLVYKDDMDEGKTPLNAIDLIIEIVREVQLNYPDKKIAILASFRDTSNALNRQDASL